ncbi:hypothetical protein HUT19_41180 [Streptomyces sp. NA02950]|uniref:DNA polymerase III subunit beta n=1 Tax=Streptomyces sp. NA02950 TaxID=2742137 RepID=UPI0015918CF7|nr:DNA polymerase III subunit beta [Streptomyces sp. NA02950]QKV90372.1 hypothetical protein HUT19_00040 [Streptomyces sp. NA02950]QKV97295.1 hypothetical protein HUT19_41180 [Streptomyces sp. NA02950]
MVNPVRTPSPSTAERPVRFRARHQDLTTALKLTALAVPARPAVPIAGGIVAQAQGRVVKLRASDQEVAVTVSVPAEPGPSGCSVLDYDELKKVVAAVVKGEPKAAAAETVVTVEDGQLSTPHVSVPLTTYPLEEYASLPPTVPPTVTVAGPEFFGQLARVLPAASTDPTQTTLTMTHFTLSGGVLEVEATDRRRVARAEVAAQPRQTMATEPPRSALIPARVLTAIVKHMGKHTGPIGIGIRADDSNAFISLTMGTTEVTIHCEMRDFLFLNPYFPRESHTALTVNRTAMVNATKKGHALATAKGVAAEYVTVTAQWNADGELTLAPYVGDDEEQARVRGVKVPADITHGRGAHVPGATLTLGTGYLLDALSAFSSDTVTLHLGESENGQFRRPVLFTECDAISGEGYRHLLVPVELH